MNMQAELGSAPVTRLVVGIDTLVHIERELRNWTSMWLSLEATKTELTRTDQTSLLPTSFQS